ncbi:MAG: WYL domain-containing protein, partial [Planctomycetota bacterium]
MARNEQLIRQHKLLQLLEVSRFGRTLEELRGDLVLDLGLTTLHERTVRRDIEALQAAGFDIQNEVVQRGKVFKLGGNQTGVHEIGISSSEMIALAIGRELLNPLAGTQYWRGIETFWNKLQEAVPDGVYDHFARHREALHVFGSPHKSYEQHAGMLKTVN